MAYRHFGMATTVLIIYGKRLTQNNILLVGLSDIVPNVRSMWASHLR